MGAVVGALLRKELLVELRTLESVPGMSLFAVTTFVVFHFALNRNSVDGDLAAGILWVTLLFAAILGINRLFVEASESARRLFAHKGFALLRRQDLVVQGVDIHNYVMEKLIGAAPGP